MAGKAASEGQLGDLHNKIARVMAGALEQIETDQLLYQKVADKMMQDGEEVMPIVAPDINPALLSVIERFLSNNNITCAPEAGNTMGELEQRLAAKRARRAKSVGNVVHLTDE
ncbi:hypothetical protein [Stappia phage SI01]|uniref:Terminase small subunit n=1 Tax=Stappia phage SI01 TaxID=2847766 RepID=A0AAE7SNH2_9CAUD|nr:hypothetical protein [Stappia phage SI01]